MPPSSSTRSTSQPSSGSGSSSAVASVACRPGAELTRPNATRTVETLIPRASPIAAKLRPCSSSSRARLMIRPVSLRGPFGPVFAVISPPTPSASNLRRQRHGVSTLTPNPSATVTAEAISVVTSCTAASRRPTSSPASKANVAIPQTNTTPPSGPSTNPATGPIGTASAGSNGSTAWVIRRIPTTHHRESLHKLSQIKRVGDRTDTPQIGI